MVKNPPATARDVRNMGSIAGSGRFPWRRAWQPTPVFLPGESQGQRSLAGYSPWGCKESDTTELLRKHAQVPGHRCINIFGGPPFNQLHRIWGTFLKKQVRAGAHLSRGRVGAFRQRGGRVPDRDQGSKEEVDRVSSGRTSRAPGHHPLPLGNFHLIPEQ